MIAQLTAIFRSGKELSENPNWNRLCIDFTCHTFMAAADLNKWPRCLRPLVHWFLPSFKFVRNDIQEARAIYARTSAERQAKKREAIAKGEKPPQYYDIAYWMEEDAKGETFDAAMAQMMVAQAQVHGMADLITKTLFDICERPELIEKLREEIFSVLGKECLSQSSLSNLHLMDSVIKETQRINPLALGMLSFHLYFSYA